MRRDNIVNARSSRGVLIEPFRAAALAKFSFYFFFSFFLFDAVFSQKYYFLAVLDLRLDERVFAGSPTIILILFSDVALPIISTVTGGRGTCTFLCE